MANRIPKGRRLTGRRHKSGPTGQGRQILPQPQRRSGSWRRHRWPAGRFQPWQRPFSPHSPPVLPPAGTGPFAVPHGLLWRSGRHGWPHAPSGPQPSQHGPLFYHPPGGAGNRLCVAHGPATACLLYGRCFAFPFGRGPASWAGSTFGRMGDTVPSRLPPFPCAVLPEDRRSPTGCIGSCPLPAG